MPTEDLDDFHHEIVQAYQLGQRKETDIDRGEHSKPISHCNEPIRRF